VKLCRKRVPGDILRFYVAIGNCKNKVGAVTTHIQLLKLVVDIERGWYEEQEQKRKKAREDRLQDRKSVHWPLLVDRK